MTVAAFEYKKILSSRWTASPQKSVRRTPIENGLPKQIPRFSRTLSVNNMSYLLTAQQYQEFIIWWKDTASFGSQWFDFTDPVNDVVIEGRIQEGNYQVRPYDVCYSHFEITMVVEAWI